jgi:hypothetical protein
VPAHLEHVVTKPEMGPQAKLVDAALQVFMNLTLAREHSVPVGVRRERERVQRTLHVARAPWITVVAPHSTDVIGPFQNDEVVDTRLLQLDGHAQSAEATPDHRDVRVRVAGVLALRHSHIQGLSLV